VRAFVTGATGFIGGRVSRALVERGWTVTALARSPERTQSLRDIGVSVVPGDITEAATLAGPMRRADAVFHLAAWYALGVPDRSRMYQVNVKGTENVLWAAAEAEVGRIVYCSTTAVLGSHSPGDVEDESARHHGRFGSAYEETKWMAHEKVRELAAGGLPVLTVMPGAVYGPGDPSILGVLLRLYAKGWLLACPFLDAAFSWVQVDDLAEGIVSAHDKGRTAEEYILGGDNATISELLHRAAPLTGIRAPRFGVPERVLRLSLPFSPVIGRVLGQPPRILRDGLESMSGSFEFSSDKARRELGYTYRSIEDGIPETVRWFKEN